MRQYRLPDHLGVCDVDGRTLMLDLRRDRYFELDPGSALAIRHWRDGRQDLPGDAALARLLERGLLIQAEPAPPARAVPHQSLMDQASSPRPAWPLVPEIARTLWRVRRRLGRDGLEGAVEEVRSRKPQAGLGDPLPHVARFRAARRLVPVAPNCLADSLALSAFLARRTISFELVFGVKLDPFAAHCWLQDDKAILNDAADAVASFTPIMVV